MIFRKTYIFVHVESYNVFERYLTFLVQFDQSLVHAEWRRTSRATQDEWLFRSWVSSVDFTSYIVSSPLRNRLIVQSEFIVFEYIQEDGYYGQN